MPSFIRTKSFQCLLVVALVAAVRLPAQVRLNAASDTGHVDAALQSEVLLEAAHLIEDNYIFSDSARHFADALRSKATAHSYAQVSQAGAFSATLTGDLRAMAHDLHLAVLSPGMVRALAASRNGVRDPGGPGAGERTHNFYFDEYRHLDGNVGYLRLRQFPRPDSGAFATAAAAMRLLATADAVILDLRDNPGGAEGLNQYLSSYFFTDSTRVLYQRYYRVGDTTTTVRVLPRVPGSRMPSVPLFVLVNRHTGSAAENMAYALQTSGRATVVGEPTAGGANSATLMPLPGGFAIELPIARVISPATKTNWEGIGVQPDVRIASDSALDAAERLVAQRAGATHAAPTDAGSHTPPPGAPPPQRNAPTGVATDLRAYVGSYGDRKVSLENGELVLVRPAGRPNVLVRATADTFIIRDIPEAKLVFLPDGTGRIVELRVLTLQGSWETAKRSGP